MCTLNLQCSEEVDPVVLFNGQGCSPEVDIDHGQQVLHMTTDITLLIHFDDND